MKNINTFITESMENECVMEMYFDIFSNHDEPRLITEATVNRMINKHAKDGFVIVSAHRMGQTKRETKAATKELIKLIKQAGYSYFTVYGGYKDKDNAEVDKYELSFFITNYKKNVKQEDFEPLKQLAIKACGEFGQDSVLIVEPEGKPYYADRNGEIVGKEVDNAVTAVNRIEKLYFTALSKKTTGTNRFTYDIAFEMYCNPLPCTVNERRRREGTGEIILNIEDENN